MKVNIKKMTVLALSVTLAMILSFVESQIPPLSTVPGVKLGLANIVAVVLLYLYGWREACAVSLIRILLTALLFGNAFALIYSLSGGALSLLIMIFAKRFLPFGKVGVSVLGALMHNVGQILAAIAVMRTLAISLYLIPLVVTGTVSGVLVGILAAVISARVDLSLKK